MVGKDVKIKWDYTEFFKGLERYQKFAAAKMHEAGIKVGEDGLMRMVEAAPVITGYLRGSASVHVNGFVQATGPGKGNPKTGALKPEKDKTMIVWGFNAHYAAKRHELDKPGIKGGGGKFVENPLKKNMDRWMKFIADELKKG